MYDGCAGSPREGLVPGRIFCKDTARQTPLAHRDCQFDIRCTAGRPAVRPLRGYWMQHSVRRLGALSQIIQDLFPIRKRFRSVPNPHCPWRLSASATTSSATKTPRSADARPLATAIVIRHFVRAGSSRFDLAGVFGGIMLIFERPVRGVFDELFERFRDHSATIPQSPVLENS